MNPILFFGAVLGLMAVGMGAYTDHVLSPVVDAKTFMMVQTALHYHLIHSVLVVAIGLALFANFSENLCGRLTLSGWIFILGIILFSFSIYLKAITGIGGWIKITPIGGTILMLGWTTLVWASFAKNKIPHLFSR